MRVLTLGRTEHSKELALASGSSIHQSKTTPGVEGRVEEKMVSVCIHEEDDSCNLVEE